ncbi:NUDIX domain-containing protein [Candidatus Woesearchaeota archaeon]|nr:NUDIX domain-containing protein [Candidatus Woesearchaeota archaeon]
MTATIQAGVLCPIRWGHDGIETLLVRRAFWDSKHRRPMAFPGEWVSPGGCKEENDRDLLATAIREAKEEVGYDGSIVRPRFLRAATLPAYGKEYYIEFYTGEFESGGLSVDGKEIIECEWMAPHDALDLMGSEAFTSELQREYRHRGLDNPAYGKYATIERRMPVETMKTLELLGELI